MQIIANLCKPMQVAILGETGGGSECVANVCLRITLFPPRRAPPFSHPADIYLFFPNTSTYYDLELLLPKVADKSRELLSIRENIDKQMIG